MQLVQLRKYLNAILLLNSLIPLVENIHLVYVRRIHPVLLYKFLEKKSVPCYNETNN